MFIRKFEKNSGGKKKLFFKIQILKAQKKMEFRSSFTENFVLKAALSNQVNFFPKIHPRSTLKSSVRLDFARRNSRLGPGKPLGAWFQAFLRPRDPNNLSSSRAPLSLGAVE
jgi:hypothetical protein